MRHTRLQHPECPPFCDPNFGYHPTCWRKFPPICRPCPPTLGSQPQRLPPAPKAPEPQAEARRSGREPVYRLARPAEYIESAEIGWRPSRSAATRR